MVVGPPVDPSLLERPFALGPFPDMVEDNEAVPLADVEAAKLSRLPDPGASAGCLPPLMMGDTDRPGLHASAACRCAHRGISSVRDGEVFGRMDSVSGSLRRARG